MTQNDINHVLALRELAAQIQQRIDHYTFGAYWGTDSENLWQSQLKELLNRKGS